MLLYLLSVGLSVTLGLMNFVDRYRKVAEIPSPILESVALGPFAAAIDRLMSPMLEAAKAAYRSQVEPADLGLAGHRRGGGLSLLCVAHGEDDAGAGAGERVGGGAADAAVGAGDDRGAAGQAGNV